MGKLFEDICFYANFPRRNANAKSTMVFSEAI